ncbi:MAG: hypothetical protein JSR58_01225 [Verrucomicrobia bacterium]|nr:hypothetical protein [Verrucomicrobiota bacterium]
MSQRKITSAVILIHLFVIMTFLFTPERKAAKPHHVAVRTHLSQPKTPIKTGSVAKAGAKPASPKKNPPKAAAKPKNNASVAAKKKTPKKMVAVDAEKKARPKKSPPPKVEEPEEIAQTEIAPKPQKRYSGPQLDIPAPIGALEIDQKSSDHFFAVEGPADEFISFLHSALHLPDFGEVKIELTLGEKGVVDKVVVLKSESAKNKAYLEKELPLLKFPNVDTKSRTLILTFCNEI